MPGNAVVRHVVTFGRVLREAGLEVGPGRIQDALLGLDSVDLTRQDDVYWTLRTTIVSRREELEAFDNAFHLVPRRRPQAAAPPKPPTAQANRAMTVRTQRSEGDADSKLDAIIKKLDERTETIEKLDKKVEGLRHEIDQLRKK